MSQLYIATRGIDSWRQRLANPERQWRRGYSAFETAVAWEFAARTGSGIPVPLRELFSSTNIGSASLILAIAEHKVPLPGGNADSQCDVWAIVGSSAGMLSLSVEAKARETFGNDSLEQWLAAGKTDRAKANRQQRWEFIRSHLPPLTTPLPLRYQMLHRCAASVIEARRLGLRQAAFVVQAFNAPAGSFQEYERFCQALNIDAVRGRMGSTSTGETALHVGWADCALATDQQVAAVSV